MMQNQRMNDPSNHAPAACTDQWQREDREHIERSQPAKRHVGAAILCAALALPGLTSTPAQAESAPTGGFIGLRYLHYNDWQPGLNRISVIAPSLGFMAPFAGKWALSGSLVSDSVSGASPRWHTSTTSASRMQDKRLGSELKLTRYWNRASVTVGTTFSTEHDYQSHAYSALGKFSSEDNNTTWAFGAGFANDSINPVNQIVVGEQKRTRDLMFGVTQNLTPNDIAQLNFTYATGHGYYNDPYKLPDNRPNYRNQYAIQARWNHFFKEMDAALRFGYRLYSDSFQVKAHTLTAEWAQTLSHGWTVTPSLRLHSQSAASFYYDPVYGSQGEPFPPGYSNNPNGYYSADQRLSAFGGRSIGIKVAKALDKEWEVDSRLEY
jgi:Protein of unknown function (DUF3570)